MLQQTDEGNNLAADLFFSHISTSLSARRASPSLILHFHKSCRSPIFTSSHTFRHVFSDSQLFFALLHSEGALCRAIVSGGFLFQSEVLSNYQNEPSV